MNAPTVLIAEDDPDLRELIAITLVDAGLQVEVAADGREALVQVAARRPDIVLLDMMMPVMDGTAFSDALHTVPNPPPIVVMTAADRAAQSAQRVGAVSWLAKPFDIDELVAKIRSCLPAAAFGGNRE